MGIFKRRISYYLSLLFLLLLPLSGCLPSPGPYPPTVTQVAAGYWYTLALTQDGRVYAWGRNDHGQLGDVTTTNRNKPVLVKLPSGVTAVAVAAGEAHSFAITSNHEVYAWGYNNHGQLGDGSKTDRLTPVKLNSLSDIYIIAAGSSHTMAIQSGGYLWMWGDNSLYQIGMQTPPEQLTPVKYTASAMLLNNITAIAAGGNHSLAVHDSNIPFAWGANNNGQLGNGQPTIPKSSTPDSVKLTSTTYPITDAIAAGSSHTLILRNDGAVLACGSNGYNQLGFENPPSVGTSYYFLQPVGPIEDSGDIMLTGATAIAAGSVHSMAVIGGNLIYAWGFNNRGQLGIGPTLSSSVSVPTPVNLELPAGVNFVSIAAGGHHSAAVTSEGTIYVWGMNGYGEVGDGTNTDHYTPTAVQW